MKKLFFATLIAACCLGFSSCFTNPVTGRTSINLVDEASVRQQAALSYSSFLTTNKPVTGTADAATVVRVGNKMAAAVQQYLTQIAKQDLVAGYQWEFNVVNNNEANAFCMPGGKVVVYTGILPLTMNETGLAVVMGHEIAHAIARHGNERMSQSLVAEAGGITLSALISSKPQQAQQLFNTAYGIGSTLGTLAYSRTQESEADEMGLYFMAMAGYDPNEAVNFWQRMAAKGGVKPPEILSTHPSDERRINDIKGKLPKALQLYKH
ncbi:MAG: M48 family metallopeptidase [Bacteroidetes bacterium]|nr:M48 family metallopeptidase [Bacteroidota bacterium]